MSDIPTINLNDYRSGWALNRAIKKICPDNEGMKTFKITSGNNTYKVIAKRKYFFSKLEIIQTELIGHTVAQCEPCEMNALKKNRLGAFRGISNLKTILRATEGRVKSQAENYIRENIYKPLLGNSSVDDRHWEVAREYIESGLIDAKSHFLSGGSLFPGDKAPYLSENTLLHLAVRGRQPEIVRLLIAKGADPYEGYSHERSALDLANKPEYNDMVEILRQAQAEREMQMQWKTRSRLRGLP
jgi:hypothetical protein